MQNNYNTKIIYGLYTKFLSCKSLDRQIDAFSKYAYREFSQSIKLKNKKETIKYCREVYSIIDKTLLKLIETKYLYDTKMLKDIYDAVDEALMSVSIFCKLSDENIRYIVRGR